MSPHPLSYLPRFISHFLGYRPGGTAAIRLPPPPLGKVFSLAASLLFAFLGLTVLQAVFRYDSVFTERHLPGLITSYGASAVLVYGLPSSPLAQPRALIGGHFFSALTGIIIYKLFSLMPSTQLVNVDWLGGALATAIALVVMDVTDTTHPPAGATAILPVVQADIIDLGWNLLWIMLLSSVLLMGVGCVGNNILGQYPTFWIQKEPFPWIDKEDGKEKKDKAKGEVESSGNANDSAQFDPHQWRRSRDDSRSRSRSRSRSPSERSTEGNGRSAAA